MPSSARHYAPIAFLLGIGLPSMAFDMSLNTNLVAYWGQNSYGATHSSDTAHFQQPISYYCGDNTIDTFPIAFLDEFYSAGGLPSINLANTCNNVDNPVFPGTNLPDCTFLASDIELCQAAGKIVTLSLGGATGAVGFTNDSQGEAYAKVIWDTFLGGTSETRPFGAAVLDGVDMDIEGGSQTGYAAFLNALRTLMDGGSKKYYITAAPQCPYPDAYIGTTLNQVSFDAVYVQFYNNYCGLNNYNISNDWDFGTWATWATTTSPNPSIKIYLGAPASSSAASSGYIDASRFASVIQETMAGYGETFGGVMLWDVSQAYANDRYDVAVKNALLGGASGGGGSTVSISVTAGPTTTTRPTTTTTAKVTTTPPPTSTSTPTPTTATTTPTSTPSCSTIPPWQTGVAYIGGDQVTYNGYVWTAKWWTENDVPGGPAGVWANDGACAGAA